MRSDVVTKQFWGGDLGISVIGAPDIYQLNRTPTKTTQSIPIVYYTIYNKYQNHITGCSQNNALIFMGNKFLLEHCAQK